MKQLFLRWSINKIKKGYPQYDSIKLDELRYGLEGIYLSITKLVILTIISILIGITKEFFIFLLLYNIIRAFGFGLHATKSWICLVSSAAVFVTLPYVSRFIIMPTYLILILGIAACILVALYAPADTHKRPLIRPKKRRRLKILASLVSLIYVVTALITTNHFFANALIFSLLTETVLILPLTYRIFKLPYNNYKTYKQKIVAV